MISTSRHWIVASRDRGPKPNPCMHHSRDLAINEAGRLSIQAPHDSFVIYEAVAVVKATSPYTVEALDGSQFDDEIAPPF
jgi:hypothetical protein